MGTVPLITECQALCARDTRCLTLCEQLIDNLSYTYTGNQITKIEDASTYTPTYTGAFNFVNGASQSGEYTYDQNGNMTKDLNKNISSISYNLLNLPTNITYSSGKSAAYVYDATGGKLRTSYKASASATPVPTDYCGNMIYENGVLKQILLTKCQTLCVLNYEVHKFIV